MAGVKGKSGGARKGAGAPKKNPLKKKKQVAFYLLEEEINAIGGMEATRSAAEKSTKRIAKKKIESI